MTRAAKFSRDGKLIEDDDDILRDGQTLRVGLMLSDGKPAPSGQTANDGLPPGVTMLADGSAKYVFPDGSSVVMSPDTSVTYFDAGGYMSQGLTDHQYLFAAERAGGNAGRQKAFDGMVDAAAHREVMIANLNNAWRDGA